MPSVFRRGSERNDLIEHFVYLAENAGEARAHYFLDNAELTFSDLLRFPDMGSPAHPRGITILRVLYAQQDWWGLFGVEQKSKP